MDVEQKIRVYIPSGLAYGQRGNQSIPPNTILVFEMEIIEVIP